MHPFPSWAADTGDVLIHHMVHTENDKTAAWLRSVFHELTHQGWPIMITGSSGDDRRQIPFISLMPFLLIAFGLAWGILAL